MPTIPPQSECRKFHGTIFWHKSSRTGKNYPTDSATDRRAFHKCEESAPEQPTKPVEKPLQPDYFEATIEQRVAALEKQVSQLSRTIRAVEARQPITSEDVGF